MTPERWERIAGIFDAAQDCPPQKRTRLLRRLCHGDAGLQTEVEALLASAAAAGGFLSSAPGLGGAPPPEAPPGWAPGAVLAGRFVLLRLLGRGGMGEVYAARDQSLNIEVALKVVRAGIAADPQALARFKREILTARRISHPHVCRIYDLAVEPGDPPVYVLTMELLPGGTLAEVLRREGPPPEAQARRWLRQIAAGLDAAHAAGVIHRDFKPANVMFRPGREGPDAVITDFGLARWAAAEPAGSSGDRLIGTLAYMAPEQLAGGEAAAAADVYAFGLVTYEMLTGRAAFAGRGPLGAVLQRMRHGHTPPGALRPELDRAWDGVVAACLAEEPADRPASTAAALAVLPPAPRARRRWRGRLGAAALTAAAAAVLAFAAYRYARLTPAVPAGGEVLLTGVTNATGNPQLDAVNVLLRSQLDQSAQFRLTTLVQAQHGLQRLGAPAVLAMVVLAQRPRLARRVARLRGVRLVVFAGLSRVGGEYRLAIELQRIGRDASAAARTWTATETASTQDELFDAVQAGANWIRRMAGEPPQNLATTDQPPQDIASPSWAAIAAYRRAEQADATGHHNAAIALLRAATRRDPGFAVAYARLGDLLIASGNCAAGYADYLRALARANQRRLSQRERLRLEGEYAGDAWNWAGAAQSFGAFAALYPLNALGWTLQGEAEAELGHQAAAFAAWERAESVAPRAAGAAGAAAALDIAQGDRTAAMAAVRREAGWGWPEPAAVQRAEIAFVAGDAAGAARRLAGPEHAADRGDRIQAWETDACLRAELGEYRTARAALRQALAAASPAIYARSRARARLALAYLAWRAGDRARARRQAQAALAADDSLGTLAAAGALLAESGDAAGVQRALAGVRTLQFLQPRAAAAAGRIHGAWLLSQGQSAAGVRALQRAAARSGDLGLTPFYLVRALARAGRPRAALRLGEQWTRSPGVVWEAADQHFPGRYADLLFETAKLSDTLGLPDARARWRKYLALRRHADAGLPDVRYAERRLAALSRSQSTL